MRAFILLVLAGCGHATMTCEIDKLPQRDQGRAIEVTLALLTSPTWVGDLVALSDNIGKAKVNCLVKADIEALMQVANRSPSDTFVVEPHIAVGVERGREWLKVGPQRADACAGNKP